MRLPSTSELEWICLPWFRLSEVLNVVKKGYFSSKVLLMANNLQPKAGAISERLVLSLPMIVVSEGCMSSEAWVPLLSNSFSFLQQFLLLECKTGWTVGCPVLWHQKLAAFLSFNPLPASGAPQPLLYLLYDDVFSKRLFFSFPVTWS